MKRLLTALILFLAGVTGCSESRPAKDGGMVLVDRGPDQWPPEPDLPPRDRGADGVPDGPLYRDGPPDVGTPTDAAPGNATVLYGRSQNAGTLGLWTVTSPSGTPQPVPGWSGLVELEELSLTGLDEDPPVSRTVARVTEEAHQDFRGVELPGIGSLYYFHRKLLGSSGLLLIRPDGTLDVLLEVPGLYSDTLSGYVGLTPDNKIGAVVQGKDKVLLFRTDGVAFPNGNSWIDVTGALKFKEVRPQSVLLGDGWLYCVALTEGGGDQLLRAPLTGNAALTAVSLPQSGGKPATSIEPQPILGVDGKLLLIAAGETPSARDIYTVDVPTGTAKNITKKPGPVASPGDRFGQPTGGLWAVSPTGKRVAYVQWEQGVPELYVVPGDGGGKPEQVTSATRFESAVVQLLNLHFADDQNLLFMAGVTLNQLDLFRWDAATPKLENVTAYGSSTLPISGYGVFYPRAGWVDPSTNRLYWVEYNANTDVSDLMSYDLSAKKLSHLTQNAELTAATSNFAACHKTGKLYFVAEPNPVQNNREIWRLDLSSGKAVRLTTMSTTPTAYWYVFDLVASDDCARLAWTAGGSHNLRHVYVMDEPGPKLPIKVTLVPRFVDASLRLTADKSTVVFASGGAEGSATLKAAAAAPGAPPVTLDTKPGVYHVFAVY
jgi:Tol biopolymer transport system component